MEYFLQVKKFLYRNATLSLFVAAFLVMLPSYNKYWAPYDEGNYLTTAMFVTKGMVPYRDFFLIMYPPGQAYAVSALLKIFGGSLIAPRIYNIILLSVVSASVFAIVSKIRPRRDGLIAFAACLVVMASLGEGPIPRAIWPGVASGLLATLFMSDFILREKPIFFYLSSFFLGISAIFRHDIGFLTFVPVIIGIFLYSVYFYREKSPGRPPAAKTAVKLCMLYSVLPLVFLAALFIWLYRTNALNDAFRALFVLPAAFGKWAAIPMPGFCFDVTKIFHQKCLFIRMNMFYIPIIICTVNIVLLASEIVLTKRLDKKAIVIIMVLLSGLFYMQQLVRADGNHLAVAFPYSAALFGIIFGYGTNLTNVSFRAAKKILTTILVLFISLFMWYGVEKYVKDIIIKPFVKKSIEAVYFRQGTIYLPDDTTEAFVSLAKYVEDNTAVGERIYIGSLKHNVPQMGWFDLLYFITDRLPAVRYYIAIPGFQSRDDIQEEMVSDLGRNNARILLLRDFGDATPGRLDKYIRANYALDKIIDSYYIYVRK